MTAWSGMTLIAFPPWIIVTLTVVSFAEFASEASCKAWWDASTMALRPFSGSKPECAARPMISTVITAEPFRAISRPSGGTPRSRLMTASLSLACARMRSRVPTEPVSSFELRIKVISA